MRPPAAARSGILLGLRIVRAWPPGLADARREAIMRPGTVACTRGGLGRDQAEGKRVSGRDLWISSRRVGPAPLVRATLGHTNEIGSMPELLEELHDAYGRTNLFRMLTTDAGNTSLKVAGLIKGHRWDYFLQIKSGHGDLYAEAVRAMGSAPTADAERNYSDQQNGKTISYHVWRHDLTEQGWLDWDHARQLVRVQRVAEDPHTGEVTTGNRYYVSSRGPSELGPMACLKISRGHWRCEDETHWTPLDQGRGPAGGPSAHGLVATSPTTSQGCVRGVGRAHDRAQHPRCGPQAQPHRL